MLIDGRQLAQTLYTTLKKRVAILKKEDCTPHLAVILVGKDPASHAYVNQKQKRGSEIGCLVTIHMFPEEITTDELFREIQLLNRDPLVHAVVVQQPLPKHLDTEQLVQGVDPLKDVDGFHDQSSFAPPIAEAVIYVLKSLNKEKSFSSWLKKQSVTVIGKGETGGFPIAQKFKKLGVKPSVIDRSTTNPDEILQSSDIVVSCVGRENPVDYTKLKKGAILLGVGMYKGDDGKLHADYDTAQIETIAGYYTPVPGGMGPVNVAMLLKNVVDAAEQERNL